MTQHGVGDSIPGDYLFGSVGNTTDLCCPGGLTSKQLGHFVPNSGVFCHSQMFFGQIIQLVAEFMLINLCGSYDSIVNPIQGKLDPSIPEHPVIKASVMAHDTAV